MQYIRTDANEIIGSGHVMRCLSIAEEFHERGEEVTFIIADTCSQNMILERGFKTLCLYSRWNELDWEVNALVRMIQEKQISLLLIDSYFVTEYYLKIIGKYTKSAYIDDINRFIYPVDFLINYNIYAETLAYQLRYCEAGINARFALGCRYAPLRKEFFSVKREARKRISSILITSGGSDSYDVTGHLLKSINEWGWFESFDYYVILGRFNKNRCRLINDWKQFKNVHLLIDINNIVDYMKSCDIAITAGGVTTYELCACGTPSIMYTLADNQMDIARSVSELGLIPWVGDIRQDMSGCIKRILKYIEEFDKNTDSLQRISQKMQDIVDGRGRVHIVNWLLGSGIAD